MPCCVMPVLNVLMHVKVIAVLMKMLCVGLANTHGASTHDDCCRNK